ncbi:MAG TPA: hypothetical protein PLD81_02760 [Elusimicrobiales bacterium]|mgnify:CR=1 FL=1|nr:hypothetical protein [Elusimicrobiales bacterium]
MKTKLLFLVFVNTIQLIYAEENISTRNIPVKNELKVQSVVNAEYKEYIDPKEFDNILKEAEDKLKMEKEKSDKSLRDYVFRMIPVKKDMYPHEKFETTNFLLELKENQPELTIKLFSKEIEINKANPYAYYERAGVYLKGCFAKVDKKACENAIKDLNESLKYVKNDTETTIDGLPFRWSIYEMLGRIYSYSETDINDFNKGLFYFTKNINADTSKPSISYYDRAKVYLKLDKFEQAIKDLSEYKKSTMQFEDEKKTIL